MPEKKIVCGVAEPKKNERRGTMKECAEKKQVRYYGIKKVDKIIIDKLVAKKPKKKEKTYEEVMGITVGLKTRAAHIRKSMEIAKRKKNDAKLEELEKELDATRKEYAKILPLAKKMLEEKERMKNDKSAKKKK